MTYDITTEPCLSCGGALPAGTRRFSVTHERMRVSGGIGSVEECIQLAVFCETCANAKRVLTYLQKRLSVLRGSDASVCKGDGPPCNRCGGAVPEGELFQALAWTFEIVRDGIADAQSGEAIFQIGAICAESLDLRAHVSEALGERFDEAGPASCRAS